MQLDMDYLPGAFYVSFASREAWEKAIARQRSALVRSSPGLSTWVGLGLGGLLSRQAGPGHGAGAPLLLSGAQQPRPRHVVVRGWAWQAGPGHGGCRAPLLRAWCQAGQASAWG